MCDAIRHRSIVRPDRVIAWSMGFLLAGVPAAAFAATDDPPRATAPADDPPTRGAPGAGGERRPGPPDRRGPGFGPPRGRGEGEGRPGPGLPGGEPDGDGRENPARILEVLRDVNPAWASGFEERMRSDPEGARRALLQGGRRIMALAVLRDRNPELYALKIAELRQQGEVRRIAVAWHEAKDAGRDDERERLGRELEEAARVSVDLGLKARAEELAALERTVREFRDELGLDAARAEERARELAERMQRRAPSGNPLDPLGPRGPRGDGERPERDPEARRAPPEP